jgi:hypothetical protein
LDPSRIDQILSDAGEKLKKEFPIMEFFVFLLPFDPAMFSHLGAEEKRRMESDAISAATKVFENNLKK